MDSEPGALKDEALVEEACKRVKDQLAAVDPEALIEVNLDVQVEGKRVGEDRSSTRSLTG